MKDPVRFAEAVLEAVGGRDNLRHVRNCATRLYLIVNDPSLVKKEQLDDIPECTSASLRDSRAEFYLGANTEEGLNAVLKTADWDPDREIEEELPEPKKDLMYYLSRFGSIAAPVFFPIIPALIIGGLVLAVRNLLVNYAGVPADSGAFALFTAFFEAGFSFLPVYIGYTAAQKAGLPPVMGMFLGALMIGNTYQSGAIPDVFGIPMPQIDYRSTIVPVILGVIFMYYTGRLLDRVIPAILKFFLKPLLTMIITAAATLFLLGPIGTIVSGWTASFVLWISDTLGFIAVPVLCVLYPYMVMLGIDKALAPISIQLIAETGFDPLLGVVGFISNLCVGAAAVSLGFLTKDPERRGMFQSFGVTGLCGVSEPGMYGALISRPRALMGVGIGAAAAGLFAGIAGLHTFVLGGCPGLLTFVYFIDSTGSLRHVILALITALIAMAVTFVSVRILMKRR